MAFGFIIMTKILKKGIYAVLLLKKILTCHQNNSYNKQIERYIKMFSRINREKAYIYTLKIIIIMKLYSEIQQPIFKEWKLRYYAL